MVSKAMAEIRLKEKYFFREMFMKKLFLSAMAVASAAAIFLAGCSDISESESTSYSDSFDRDFKVSELLEKTSINLVEGCTINDLGMSIDERESMLNKSIENTCGRSVLPTDYKIDIGDLGSILESASSEIEIPDMENLEEDDIEKVIEDFPGLSKTDVAEFRDEIFSIYQDQIAYLAMDEIVKTVSSKVLDNTTNDRSVYDKSINIRDEEITGYEIAACLKHPLSAVGLKKQKNKAQSLTETYMGSKNNINGRTDAFRHIIWNIVMAKEGVGLKKERLAWARDFSTAHEKGVKNNGADSVMDLHNNLVGRTIFDDSTSRRYKKILFIKIEYGIKMPSYDYFCNIVKNKVCNATFISKQDNSYDELKKRIDALSSHTAVYIEEK